jgi:RHS repeat-associated protein
MERQQGISYLGPPALACDAQGNQTLIRDPLDRETWFTYDAHGNETSRTLPIGVSTTADPDDFVERKVYSSRSIATAIAAGEAAAESVALGQLAYEVSFEGVVTAYRYDNSPGAGGRLVATYYYGGPGAEATYLTDAADGSLSDAQEMVGYRYDAFGRQMHAVQDGDGDLATTGDQRVTENVYDSAGQLVTVVSPEGVIHYEYDDVTGLHQRTWTAADTTTTAIEATTDTHYVYDTLGRLDTVTVDRRNGSGIAEEMTDYVYDLLGNLDQVRLPNGVISDYDYDTLNRLDRLRQFQDVDGNQAYDAADVLLAEYDYDLAADGKRTGVTEKTLVDSVLQETRIDWLYDRLGRLTREVYDSHADDTLDYTADYLLDLVGNRRTKNVDTQPTEQELADYRAGAAMTPEHIDEATTSAYDANDRLLTETKDVAGGTENDRRIEYQYGDSNEKTQQTKKTIKLHTDGSGGTLEETTYVYNLQGRMSQTLLDQDGDGTVDQQLDYTYDADGVRTSQTEITDTDEDGSLADETPAKTVYLYDANNPTGYAQILEEKDAAGSVTKTYTLGLDVIAQQAPTIQGGENLSLLYDGHGSTRALMDASGAIVVGQVFAYDAFGNRLDSADALTRLLYSGEQTDRTGLQYLRARYYDPNRGRFNRLDPFAGDMEDPQSLHKYLYCHAQPVNGTDPTGQFFGLLLGAAMDTNFQSMMTSFYDGAFEVAQSGLAALDDFYNVRLLQAFSYMDSPPPWVTNALTVLPILAAVMGPGQTIRVSQLVNMTSVQWGQFMLEHFGHLPKAHQAGRVGEAIVEAYLKKQGYERVISLTNKSLNGIDALAFKNGQWEVFEIKAHILEGSAKLSDLQMKGPKAYAEYVLGRIASEKGKWANVTLDVRKVAKELQRYIDKGGMISGTIFNVDYALDTAEVILKKAIWKKIRK